MGHHQFIVHFYRKRNQLKLERIKNFITFIARYNNEIIAFTQLKMIRKAL